MLRWTRVVALPAVAIVLIATASIAVALLVTPAQNVSTAGQTIGVGTTGPSLRLSGPGELDLFGQKLDTTIEFDGPIRPRIRLTHITLSKQLQEFARSSSGADTVHALDDAVVQGLRHYLYWQIAIAAAVAILLAGAVSGWLRRGWRRSMALVAAAVVVTMAVDIGAVMVTVFTAGAKVSQVHSLQALVGNAPQLQPPGSQVPRDVTGPIVVLGDSTAAGQGNPALPHPSRIDHACQRSADAYAVALANILARPVTNLACSGATVRAGLLGAQRVGSVTVPAQVTQPAVRDATTVIISIGANDVNWSGELRICAVSVSCRNNAEQAAFQQALAQFSTDYLQLLSELQSLPQHPDVLVNLYYDPFGDQVDCLSGLGVTPDKQDAIHSKLTALNSVLRSGAQAASFMTAHPNFTDHGVCSSTPFVQGISDPAPFHPTAAGELAIALADEHALETN